MTLRTITFDIPWPPSINHYYHRARRSTFLSQRAKAYRKEVWVCAAKAFALWNTSKVLTINIRLHAPKNVRVYDVDNFNKAILDALQGVVYKNDKQITVLVVEKREACIGGKAQVTIRETEGPK